MTGHRKSKSHLFCMLAPLLFCLVYLLFCAININGSVWFDESFSAYLIRGNFTDILSLTAADVHPPFFYFCLKIWSLIFGTSAISLRFMSVFFGGVSIILVFHLIKRWFNLKAATISAALLSISPLLIRYGQEMRMYTLALAIVIGATYVLELALESPNKKRYWVLYAILLALGIWTHYFVVAAWIAHLIYLIFIRKQNPLKKPLLNAYLLAVIVFAAWTPFLFQQIQNVQKGFWIPAISALTPVSYLTETFFFLDGENTTSWLVPVFLGIIIISGILIYRILKQSKLRQPFYALLIFIIIPPLVLMILSLPPFAPVFVNRYILYASSFIWVLIGVMIALYRSKKPVLKIMLSLLTLTAAIIGIVNVETRTPEENIENIISMVNQLADEKEPILTNNIWNYYSAVFYSTDEHPVYTANDWIDYQYGSEAPVKKYQYHIISDLKDFQKQHQTFWYIADAQNSDSVESPIENYRIVNEIFDGDYLAIELERE